MTSEEPPLLVGGPDLTHAPRGSTEAACSRCAAVVYVAPSGRALLATHAGMVVICLACFVADVSERGDERMTLAAPTPAQLAEVEAFFTERN